MFDVVELAALRGRAVDLGRVADRRQTSLPAVGRAALTSGPQSPGGSEKSASSTSGAVGYAIALCVRPERWLLLSQPAQSSAAAAAWQSACEGVGVAVDLSSAYTVLRLVDNATC